ncbi:MAG: PEP-CTERM sorting domain-containing protein [Planctomycetota bacterium]
MSKKDKAKQKKALDRRAKGELKKQLLSYSIAAGAALIGAQGAAADVVYSGPQNILVNSGNPSVGVDFDGGGPELSINFQSTGWSSANTWPGTGLTHTTGSNINYTYPTHTSSWGGKSNSLRVNPNAGAVATTAGPGYGAANFSKSQFVSRSGAAGTAYWAFGERLLARVSSSWSQTGYGGGWGSTWSYGNFLGAKGFIGVRFDNGAGLKFGWIEFEGASDASWGRITGWAYETSGAEIHAGDQGGEPVVPEPGGLALLAAGAAGLTALRKKRTK